MATTSNIVKNNNNEHLDLRSKSLYARLKRLFSTDVVVRNVGGKKLKIKDTAHVQYATDRNTLRDRFNRVRTSGYSQYSRDFTMAYAASRIELFRDYDCVGPDTIIPLPDGSKPTIRELAEKYKDRPQERFFVYSYDYKTDSIKLGKAFHPRKKQGGKRKCWKVVLDNGQFVIGSEKHPFLMRDCTYKRVRELKVGDSVMPFYQKGNKIYQPGEDTYKEFHYNICPNCKENFGFFDRRPNKFCSIKCYSEYRHVNYSGNNCPAYKGKKTTCSICNTEFLNPKNKKYCSKKCMVQGKTTGPTVLYQNTCKTCGEMYSITPKNKNSKYCSDKCRLDMFATSFKGKNHYLYVGGTEWNLKEPYLKSSGWNKLRDKIRKNHQYTCQECAKSEQELGENLSVHHIISPRLFENPLDANNEKNLITLCRKCHVACPDHKLNTELLKSNFPKIKHDDSEKIISEVSYYSKFMYEERFMANIEKSDSFRKNLITKNVLNHKIVAIEYVGEMEVYDVTVDEYHNFATDSCFVSNTMDCDPIISSALDLYSDECLSHNELGRVLTIRSSDDNVKNILQNLFTDILNVDFNLWSWTRNMVKYGDFYLKLHISPEYGVYLAEPLSSYNVQRIENSNPDNKNYTKFQVSFETGVMEELESYQVAHFRMLSDSNFLPYGKCLSQRSIIDTEYGAKQIRDIKIGDSIWSFNTKTNKIELTCVKNIINSGTKEILRIRTQHNFVDCSKNHPILVFNEKSKNFEYKIAENIKIGDLLIINSNKNKKYKNSILIDKNIEDDKKNTCPVFVPETDSIPEYVDNEFAEFFGFMIGDGWVKYYSYPSGGGNYRVCFALGIDEEQNKRYLSILEKYAGKKANITFHGGKSRTAILYSKRLYKIMKNMGFGDNAATKRIPQWVFESNNEIQESFIIGMGNADGWTHVDEWAKCYSIMLCNKDLIYDFKKLIQFNNIKSSIPKEKEFNDIIEICGVKCNRTSKNSFNYYLDADRELQQEKYKFIDTDEFILCPVRKIESIEDDVTWDIQVESDNMNFFANGILVHNSIIEGARRTWKQLCLLEDSMLIHRIMRAPERRIIKVDVGNIPPTEIDTYMEKLISKTKKVPYIDERTGDYNLRFNIQNMLEDFYIPVRGSDSGTSIENLSGMEFTGIDDIEYVRNKMLAALKIPKAYLSFEEDLSGKATLSQEDIRFSKTITRIQKIIVSELSKIAIVHLYSQGYKDESLVNFNLELTNPSTIFEKEKIDIWSNKMSVVKDMIETKMFDVDWIYKNVFTLTDNDISEVKGRVIEDSKRTWRLKQIEEEGNDPALSLQKVNKNGELSDSGGEGKRDSEMGEPSGELGGGMPKGEAPSVEEPATGGAPEEKGAGEVAPPLKEANKKRDQTGEKDARQYPFGEDPLGILSINEKPRKHPIKKPVLGFNEESSLSSLAAFLKKDTKRELLGEAKRENIKSMLDESNIIEQ